MKHLFLFVIAVGFTLGGLNAQQKFSIEPQIGTAVTPLKGRDAAGTTWKPSLEAGIGLGFQLGEKWSLKSGLYVANGYALYEDTLEISPLGALQGLLGNVLDGANLVSEEYVQGRSSYWNLDVPITLQYQFQNHVFVRFGGYASYMVANTNQERITTHVPLFELFDLDQLGLDAFAGLFPENGTREEVNQSTEGMNTFGYGALLSMGYESKRWVFNAGYQYGFSTIRNDDKYLNINHRQAIQLTLGYRFFPDFSTSRMKPKYDLDLIQ